MKKATTLILLLFCATFAKSQDTIIKHSGDTIIAKISEITPSEIKYKRFDYQDGPVYVELKAKIQMIKYSNGLKEAFKKEPEPVKETIIAQNDYYSGKPPANNRIETWGARYRYQNNYMNERDMHEMLIDTKDKKIIGLVGEAKDAKKMQFIGFAGIPLGATAIGFFWKSTGIFNYGNPNYTNGRIFNQRDLGIAALCGIAAVACPVISIVSKGNRNKYNRQAIKIYNEKF